MPATQELEPIPGTDIWYHELNLPEGSRMEYKFELSEHGRARLIQDPLNPHLANDPYGANSVVHGTGHEIPEWTLPNQQARPGRMEELKFKSDALPGVSFSLKRIVVDPAAAGPADAFESYVLSYRIMGQKGRMIVLPPATP